MEISVSKTAATADGQQLVNKWTEDSSTTADIVQQ